MELRFPTEQQLEAVYDRELRRAFPASELKPLRAMLRLMERGRYKPYCLFDGEEIAGTAFLWLGHPGWAVLDYLCVAESHRNGGLGAMILEKLRETEPEMMIFGEVEAPEDAPDPEMARRRLAFYARCGLKTAGYDTEMFGVHYKTLYLPGREVEDAELMEQHRYIYESSFTPENFRKYVQIPWNGVHSQKVAWSE